MQQTSQTFKNTFYSKNFENSTNINPVLNQTVSFNHQPIIQQTITTGIMSNIFKSIPRMEAVKIREDITVDIQKIFNQKKFHFNLDYINSTNCYQQKCEPHKEFQENFVFEKKNGVEIFIGNFCDICLDEGGFDQGERKVEHYTHILKQNKELLIDINNNELDLESHAENLWLNLQNLILNTGFLAVDYTKSFQEDFISKFFKIRLSEKDILDIKNIIKKIYNEKKDCVELSGIGARPEFKVQCISLAILLSTFKKKSLDTINFIEVESYLKKYILDIFNLRQRTVESYTEWLRILVGYYNSICLNGKIEIDQGFLNTINIDLFSGTRIEIVENNSYLEKYNALLAKYEYEINQMNITISNLRQQNISISSKVNEVKI